MKFTLKKHKLGEKIVSIYMPINIPRGLSAVDPISWDLAILGDTEAFEFLRTIFLIAAELKANECIYISTVKNRSIEYRDIWRAGIFDLDILMINSSHTHIKSKIWERLIDGIKYTKGNVVQIIPQKEQVEETPKFWLNDKKLNTIRRGKYFVLQTNSVSFERLSYDLDSGMTGFRDSEEYNFDFHVHEDFFGTREDNGFNFLYHYTANQDN